LAVGVGWRLKHLRTTAGYSQAALAALVNERQGSTWQQSTVWKIENDQRPLTLTDVETLADVFGMSIEAMLYGDEDPNNDPRHNLRLRALGGRLDALHFEEQALLARLADIRAERNRLRADRDIPPTDV
jgi:transcriptional regulator with XRE-family HTH domain